MSELRTSHLDDFTLLRFVAGELDERDRAEVAGHLERCPRCSRVEREVANLDGELRDLASKSDPAEPPESPMLAPGDPFRTRPLRVERRLRSGDGAALAAVAVPASERALVLSEEILEAGREPGQLASKLSGLSLSEPSHRYALLYALQESARRIAESPQRSLRLADDALSRLREDGAAFVAEAPDVERMVPRLLLRGQAHLLAGQACIWTREFDRARSHLELAYRSLARGGAEDMSLAIVELTESQRRCFLGAGQEALVLAGRALRTFEAWGLDDLTGRAKVATGLALCELGRTAEAVEAFRQALPIFERHRLWSNYVGALNSLGTSLTRAGRFSDARREYARALRQLSRQEHGSWLPFIRHGLADMLFASGRFREAAVSFSQASRLYAEGGMVARSLTASLFEIESWARYGDLSRARHRLDLFQAAASRHAALDSSVGAEIARALAGENPDLQRIAGLRRATELVLERRLGLSPA